MNILLLGSGGREHTLAWKIAQSPLTEKLYIAPGNAGTARVGINAALNPNDFNAVKNFVIQNKIVLVVVGPEEPLVNGIYDFFKNDPELAEIPIVGPSRAGAQLEGSKDFAKDFMLRHNIPTASHRTFTSDEIKAAEDFIHSTPPPFVIKADGLAAGKGVVIETDVEKAISHIHEMLVDKKFGKASEKVVIEQFLKGIELSVFVITDGNDWILLPEAKDYKRIGVGDTGLNTGGMGSVSPVPFVDLEFLDKITNRIIQPTINGLWKDKIDYRGFIFFGLIKVEDDPFVIEYNVRMGDPETESVIPRITNDLVPVLLACAEGDLTEQIIDTDPRVSATVMLVSGGYPGEYKKGYQISGLPEDINETGQQKEISMVFHAGTSLNNSNEIITAGGRVVAVTSLAHTLNDALNLSFKGAEEINFTDKYFRKDIGFDVL